MTLASLQLTEGFHHGNRILPRNHLTRGGKLERVFPDLPGCTSASDTVNEAAAADQALAAHLLLSVKHGGAISEALRLSEIEDDAEVDKVARVLVSG